VGGPMCHQDFEFLQQPCLSCWSIHFSDDWLEWKYFFLVGPGLWTSQSTVCAKRSLCRANREKIFVNSFVHQVCEVQLNASNMCARAFLECSWTSLSNWCPLKTTVCKRCFSVGACTLMEKPQLQIKQQCFDYLGS
jgi:hypothetical protein